MNGESAPRGPKTIFDVPGYFRNPEEAQTWLDSTPFPRNRPLHLPSHEDVERVQAMLAERFERGDVVGADILRMFQDLLNMPCRPRTSSAGSARLAGQVAVRGDHGYPGFRLRALLYLSFEPQAQVLEMSGPYRYQDLNAAWAGLRKQLERDPTVAELWQTVSEETDAKGFVISLRRSIRQKFLVWERQSDSVRSGPGLEDEEFPEAAFEVPSARAESSVRTILFLAADPTETGRLRLDKEAKAIEDAIQRSPHRDRLRFTTKWAVTPEAILGEILHLRPEVVHFSGHGMSESGALPSTVGSSTRNLDGPATAGAGGLVCEGDRDPRQVIPGQALRRLFEQCRNYVRCVLLNACHSEPLAEAVAQHIDHVIGMRGVITDRAATLFATGFYQALGAGHDFDSAFEFGRIAIDLHGLEEHQTPVLKSRN